MRSSLLVGEKVMLFYFVRSIEWKRNLRVRLCVGYLLYGEILEGIGEKDIREVRVFLRFGDVIY